MPSDLEALNAQIGAVVKHSTGFVPTQFEISQFDLNYIPEPNTGCWLWLHGGSRGYGTFHSVSKNKNTSASRWAYARFYGDFDSSMDVLHRCDVPGCVNPQHLFLGTPSDNAKDAMRKGRLKAPSSYPGYTSVVPHNKLKTHCAKGHELSASNTRVVTTNRGLNRKCIACIFIKNATARSKVNADPVRREARLATNREYAKKRYWEEKNGKAD